ncbi:hypothetical protein TUM17577_49460 [Enterobacter asburiae]|nr:hypothetical protein TUM17577_49460 [Enterobacter asburiae]
MDFKIISELDFNFIMDISKKRNSLVHGDSMVIPKKTDIDHLIIITEKIQGSS